MSDWLADLRESKKRAIAEDQANQAQVDGQAIAKTSLQDGHEQLLDLVGRMGIETMLHEFVEVILQDHPLFPTFSLTRLVKSRGNVVGIEVEEPAPLSGPLEDSFLPEHLHQISERWVVSIEWKLRAEYRQPNSPYSTPLVVRISAVPGELRINGQALDPATPEDLRSLFSNTFQVAVRTLNSKRKKGHHHHRPWHKRLWRALFSSVAPEGIYLVIAVIIILLSISLALIAVQAIASS